MRCGGPEVGVQAGVVDQALRVEHVAKVDTCFPEPVLHVLGELQVQLVLLEH